MNPVRVLTRYLDAALKWVPVPGANKNEPMWKSEDGRFLVITFPYRKGDPGYRKTLLEYSVTDRSTPSGGKKYTEVGTATSLSGATKLVDQYLRKAAT